MAYPIYNIKVDYEENEDMFVKADMKNNALYTVSMHTTSRRILRLADYTITERISLNINANK